MPIHTEFVSGIMGALQELYGVGGVTDETYTRVRGGLNADTITPMQVLSMVVPGSQILASWNTVASHLVDIKERIVASYSDYSGWGTLGMFGDEDITGEIEGPYVIDPNGPSVGGSPVLVQANIGTGLARLPAPALEAVRRAAGPAGRLLKEQWDRLPEWVKASAAALGWFFPDDIPFVTLFGDDNGGGMALAPVQPGAIIPVNGAGGLMAGAQVVGMWSTRPNDPNPPAWAWFYRLADGKLAVQNKLGRWKVWRPKKPIVLYASGADDLKTMLRADKALDKQAKKLRRVLDRRAPKRQPRAHKHARALTNVVDVS